MRRLKIATILVVFLTAARPVAAQFELPGASRPGSVGAEVPGSVVTVEARFTAPTAEGTSSLFVTATVAPGWHIYSITQPTSPEGNPTVTKINVQLPRGVRLAGSFRATVAPKTTKEPDAYGNLPIETHEGTVAWRAPLAWDVGVDPSRVKITGFVTVGACDANSCRPPEKISFSAALDVATPPSFTGEEKTSVAPFDLPTMLVQLGFAFLGGLILNVMPCVLPVISLKILAFIQQSGERRGRVFMLNVWYSLGMLSVFMALAALAAAAGMKWGEQFTLAWFKVALTALVFVMALSFLGVWEIPIPGFAGSGRAGVLQSREGLAGAFFKGVFTTILATPCSGPFLGSVFGYVLKQPPSTVYYVFGAIGLGMASPYLLIGAFPSLLRFLPKPGAWMETFKQIMGFLLLATVVYLFNTLTTVYFIPTMTLLVGLWFACWWIGRTPLTDPAGRITAWLGGAAVAAAVGYFAFTVLLWTPKIPWKPFSPAALAQARAEGKTVMVDFTANWCPNCKVNSRVAIETDAVLKMVQANRVEPLLADWTDRSETIAKALEDLGCASIPVLAIWPAEAKDRDVIVLRDSLLESQVLDALKRAGPSKK